MWRAFFLGMGFTCCLIGVQAMGIEKAVLKVRDVPVAQGSAVEAVGTSVGIFGKREIVPPEWAPWSLISAGAVVILYSFSIPRRAKA